jgi:hypothetical protein
MGIAAMDVLGVGGNDCKMTLEMSSSRQYHIKGGLTENECRNLHRRMEKIRLKPTLCEMCNLIPPRELACIDKYELEPKNFRWMCRSCHLKYDYKNGTRILLLPSEDIKKKISQNHADVSGDKNPFFDKKHTAVARLRIKLARLEMEYAKSHFMSGKFHVPEQEWMKSVV